MFTRFDVDFVQGLDVVGDEGDGHHQHALCAALSNFLQSFVDERLQPAAGAGATLVAQGMGVGPAAPFHHCLDCSLDMRLIGITAVDHAGGDAVGAEQQVHVGRHARGVAIGAPESFNPCSMRSTSASR